MYRFSTVTIMLVFLFALSSCDENDATETEPVEFQTAPSAELSSMINETPSDFTWGYFYDNVQVSAFPGSEWSGDVVLSVFQIQDGQVVNRATTSAYETSIDELSAEVSTETMFPGSEWFPGSQWVPGDSWIPGSGWVPGSRWSPSEIEDMAMSNADLGANQTMVVIYAHISGGPEREVTTQPFGIIFDQRQ